jgi:hypothetical protein
MLPMLGMVVDCCAVLSLFERVGGCEFAIIEVVDDYISVCTGMQSVQQQQDGKGRKPKIK